MTANAQALPVPPLDAGPTPPPDVRVAAAPAPAPRHPSQLNRAQIAQIERLELLIPICREVEFVNALIERGITAAFLTDAELKIAQARSASTGAVVHTVDSQVATVDQDTAQARLMGTLREFQSAGRLLHQRHDPVNLENYFIGIRINQSRPLLTQYAFSIITITDQERPPAITSEMIARAWDELREYTDSASPQRVEKAVAAGIRHDRDSLVKSIIADRQQIQMAAESAWPWNKPNNAGPRLKFRLPARRPYTA